jgi:hypothetical protein
MDCYSRNYDNLVVHLFRRSNHRIHYPNDYTIQLEKWQLMAPLVRKSFDNGKKVAVIGVADTECYRIANIAPYFRYSPICEHMIFKSQLDETLDQLWQNQPELVLIAMPAIRFENHDVLTGRFHEFIQLHFQFDGTIHGVEFYSKRPVKEPSEEGTK